MASDSDAEEDFVNYGTPLDPLEEDEPLKKPVPIHDQTVKDEKGRYKRFHGAFTGGFSAGYFNTVGSKEGWTPSTFVSSRQQKAEKLKIRPEDFMDEEDLGEHGIAPNEITTTDDFASGKKDQLKDKARALFSLTALIPGDTVLEDLIAPARTSVGVELLRKMGWKEGQGVGPRAKRKPRKQKDDGGQRVYGCALPPNGSEESEVEEEDYCPENVTFAPKDVTPIDFITKDDMHGLGYRGLDPLQAMGGNSGTGHFSLFTLDSDRASSLLGVSGPRNRRRGGLSGQAFGVGAMEEDDADIYHRDSLSNYDSVLGGEEPGDGLYGWTAPRQYDGKKKGSSKDADYLGKILPGFTLASKPVDAKKVFPPPELPRHYRPVHYFRPVLDASSASPLVAQALRESAGQLSQETQPKGRHQLDASQRREQLGESSLQGPSSVFELLDSKDKERLESIRRATEGSRMAESSSKERRAAMVAAGMAAAGVAAAAAKASTRSALSSRFQPASAATQEALSAWSSPTASTAQTFRPFEKNSHKQARYDLYISKLKEGDKDALDSSLDPTMTEWERGRERDEFVRSAMLYKPSSSSLSSRFTRGKNQDDENVVEVPRDQENDMDDKQAAVNMKMFGKLTRDTFEWHPEKLLCKRFNIPDPYPGSGLVGLPKVKRDKFSVFNFLTLTDSSHAGGGNSAGLSQSGTATQPGVTKPTKPAEPGKRSRWDVSAQPSEGKDTLSEFLSEARSEALVLQQGQTSPVAPTQTADPIAESKAEQPEEEEEEEKRPPMDLFKAIFASSSDEKSSSSSEGESDEEDDKDGSLNAGPQVSNLLITDPKPSGLSASGPVLPEMKAHSVQCPPAAAPPQEQRLEDEEFGPRLPPPSSPGRERPSFLTPPTREETQKKKFKEKHKSKKDHKHKKEKKQKKKHKRHKGKEKKRKRRKKKKAAEETESSSNSGDSDCDSDSEGNSGALSTEELLRRLKGLRGKKLQ